jgi:MFS family permease
MTLAMGWRKPDNVAGTSIPAVMIGLFVASGGLLFGYDTGAINGILAMPEFRRQFSTGYVDRADGLPQLSPAESSTLVAMLSAGTILGALLAAPAGDWIGRRLSLFGCCAVFCIGGIAQVCANDMATMLVGR